jgi:hypothetical protein
VIKGKMMMIDMSGFRGQMSDNRGRMEESMEDETAFLIPETRTLTPFLFNP